MAFKKRPTYNATRGYSRNRMLAQKNAVQLLGLLSSIVVLVLKIIGGVLLVIKYVGSKVLRFSIRYLALPIYSKANWVSHKTKRAQDYFRNEFGDNFSRNVMLYGGLTVLTLFAGVSNLKAREVRPEEVGRHSSLYTLLAQNSDFELIVEEGIISEDTVSQAPVAENNAIALSDIGVSSQVAPSGNIPVDELNTLVTDDSGSLVRPNVLATDITPQLRDSIITYVVEDGDTISEIAEKFQLSTNTILWENKLGPRDFIKPGQELVILPVTGVTYTVSRGDTLRAIAAKYKAEEEDILEVNKLADASELKIGAKLIVPDGIPPPAARPTVTTSSGLASIKSIFTPAPAVAGKFNWPTTSHRITQYYRGWRHTGIDIGAPIGQPIYAAEDGVVITAGWNSGGYGLYIVIDHGNGLHTLYAHSSKLLVKKGDRVKKGEVIANIGSTGRSTGPHIHFEVRSNGNRVNPLDYL